MKALAIHYGHNCTVGLAIDGEVVCLLSEERICRKKNATGYPFQALQYVVDRYLDGKIENADCIGVADGTGQGAAYLLVHGTEPKRYLDYYWKNKLSIWNRLMAQEAMFPVMSALRRLLSPIIDRMRQDKISAARSQILIAVGLNPQKVSFFDHHGCHAASAAYFSPLMTGAEWLVLTLDGEGDGLSSTVSRFHNGKFERLSSNSNQVSLGYVYAETTAYLGMKSNEHEFKLMGMAPYADSAHVDRLASELSKLIEIGTDGTFRAKNSTTAILPQLARIYAFERFDVISGAVQKLTEDLICQWAEFWIAKTGISQVAVAGGVFMNVKAAKKLLESDRVGELFVVPSTSDESLPIGVLWQMAQQNNTPVKPIRDLYLGRSFDNGYVAQMITRDGLETDFDIERFESSDAVATRVATLLAQDEIVARCCGREEWGARALGNRSILCNPSGFQNIERLNSKIKCRDFWMPFTPSLLAEEMGRYVVNPRGVFAPYMAITFDSTPLARRHFSAAVHPRDFTMRPQAVVEEWNQDYHRLIAKFRDITGIGGLLNTSFNLHGEPNVSTPEDAIRTVRNSGLDYVLIGDVLFKKKPSAQPEALVNSLEDALK